MSAEPMTRSDRETLIKIARQRERLAKSDAKSRAAHLLADFEEQMDRKYSYDENEVWKAAAEASEKVVREAKEAITAECERLGIPKEFGPGLSLSWYSRGRNGSKGERAEMRRIAERQIEAAQKSAMTEIERQSVRAQESIMITGLTTDDARQMLESLPTAEVLMPALTVEKVSALIASRKQEDPDY